MILRNGLEFFFLCVALIDCWMRQGRVTVFELAAKPPRIRYLPASSFTTPRKGDTKNSTIVRQGRFRTGCACIEFSFSFSTTLPVKCLPFTKPHTFYLGKPILRIPLYFPFLSSSFLFSPIYHLHCLFCHLKRTKYSRVIAQSGLCNVMDNSNPGILLFYNNFPSQV